MNKTVYWVSAVINVVSIISFAVLAIIFGRWWISLFALLFTTIVKTAPQHYRICDGCGKHSPPGKTRNDALNAAKDAGWTFMFGKDKDGTVRELDYCPDCQWKVSK